MKTKLFVRFIPVALAILFVSAPMLTAAEEKKSETSGTFVPGGAKTETKESPKAAPKAAPKIEKAPAKTDDDGKADPSADAPEGDADKADQAGEEEKPKMNFNYMLLMLGGVFLIMMIFSGRGRKKQQKKHQEMLDTLKKGDRVVTIGGICGTVVEVKDKEIVAKVSDNSRIRLARWAIRAAGEDAVEEDKQKDTKEDS